jgi:hypothetical protein
MVMGNVAPHEHREIALVLGGIKPLATVEHDKDPEQYVQAILLGLAGMLRYEVAPTADCPNGEVVFSLPRNAERIKQYRWTLTHGVDEYGLKGYHRAMGRLFGYSPEDIEAFIEAEIHCNCTKCKGA